MTSPFERGWWSFDLGKYRPCAGTYELYPYESLPPLDESIFADSFAWLEPDEGHADASPGDDDTVVDEGNDASDEGGDDSSGDPFDDEAGDGGDDGGDDEGDDGEGDDGEGDDEDGPGGRALSASERLDALAASLAKVGQKLPEAFVRFMGDDALQWAVPSCTACEWDLSPAPVASPVEEGAYLVRFLRDQQDCLFWYLYLGPDGTSSVVCSPIPFDDPEVNEPRDVVLANAWWCAPHFEHFVYRFWLENTLWDLVSRGEKGLTAAQAGYLNHYKERPSAG